MTTEQKLTYLQQEVVSPMLPIMEDLKEICEIQQAQLDTMTDIVTELDKRLQRLEKDLNE